ncbi:hypothetical protein B0H10DRAFT_2049644 [Mycena sp. CBHHK59/15]|nr:hypothetical protein B0H10DRAFT_2049644 [Mycena sp. CBHHK59/15]
MMRFIMKDPSQHHGEGGSHSRLLLSLYPTMSLAASIFATRYVSAVGVAALLYDHVLTLDDEIHLIWFNWAAGAGNRIGFMVNRYITEAMIIYVAYMLSGGSHGLSSQISCRVFIWIFAIASTVFVAISHFIIMARVYTLWDRRLRIKWILMGSFSVAISISMTFSILAAHQVQPFLEYNPLIHMCTFEKKPGALSFMLGALTVFDLFIIVMTVFNALDRPYQKQADVMTSLQHDGARMFVVLLRLTALVMAIVGDPANCFVTLTIVWAMCSIVNSRMQLRIEGLRFIRFTTPANGDIELFEY